MPFIKVSFILMVFIFSGAVWSESSEPAEGGEGKAASGGDTPLTKEYQNKLSQLKMYSGKIEEDEKTLLKLIAQKNHEKDAGKQSEIMKEMVALVKRRNKTADDYNLLKAELELRYPSKGQDLNRSYQTQSKKTIEDLEGSAGLDEMLTRTKKMIDKKYAPFMPAKSKAEKPNDRVKGDTKISEQKEVQIPTEEKEIKKKLRIER